LAGAFDSGPVGQRRVRVWAESQGDGFTTEGSHFDHLARLLDLESRAQAAKVAERDRRLSPAEAERTGLSVVNLVIEDEDTGLGGRHDKVLACAPSNLAVDTIFERLLARGERAVRLGHPARVTADLRAHTLDLLVVGDSATLCTHPFYRRMIDTFETLGAYRTVWEEDDTH